jgi:hypothetical protein
VPIARVHASSWQLCRAVFTRAARFVPHPTVRLDEK